MNRLSAEFYKQDVLAAAPLLLGKLLCRRLDDGSILRARINDVEAYRADDTACHAYRGRTPRNAVMFKPGGFSYVYLCYGIHNLLNVVTGNEGDPQGVMIRGIHGVYGPGRVTKALKIDRTHNAIDLRESKIIWLENDGFIPKKILTAPRIGIGYASTKDQARLWRFYFD